jgi:dipeptidyl aminopeptidase/acylaminoacyl peptidase
MRLFGGLTRLALIVSLLPTLASATIPSEVVTFQSGDVTLHGVLYKPEGTGPFPAVLYNHGSAAGMLSNEAFEAIAPVYLGHGYVFFAPYRRGQGLSASAGPFIGAEIVAARREGWKRALLIFVAAFIVLAVFLLFTTHRTWVWVRAFGIAILAVVTVGAVYLSGIRAAAAQMVKLLETDHLNDQLAAYDWLRKQDFIQPDRIAVAGNSFGGVEALLGAERVKYCAAIDAAGGSETWADASDLQARMIAAVRNSQAPIFFFQAENDYDLTPSRILFAAVNDAGKIAELRIYPPFRKSAAEGHSFAWLGASKWAEDVLAFLDDYCAG